MILTAAIGLTQFLAGWFLGDIIVYTAISLYFFLTGLLLRQRGSLRSKVVSETARGSHNSSLRTERTERAERTEKGEKWMKRARHAAGPFVVAAVAFLFLRAF